MPGIQETLFGSPDRVKQVSTLNNQQNQFLNNDIFGQLQQMLGQGGAYSGAQGYLQKLLQGGPEAFAQFEAPYRQQFEQQILPGIAERFAGANAMGGGLSSSGFAQALGGAGAQLQAQLAGLHGNLQQGASQQALGQFNQLANQGLGTRTFENIYQPGSNGLLGGALTGLAQGFGQGLSGPSGGLSSIFSMIKNLFSGGQGQAHGSPAAPGVG